MIYLIVRRCLLARDKYMPEMHLRQPGFTKNKQRLQKIMQTGDTNCVYRNDLDEACFQHDVAYGKYKDLEKRTQLDKV